MDYFTNLFTKTEEIIQSKYILDRDDKNQYFRCEPDVCKNVKYEIWIPGAAGLTPFLLGICKIIQDNFQKELDKSIIIGSSGGSFCALNLRLAIPCDDAFECGLLKFIESIKKSFMNKSLYFTDNLGASYLNYITLKKDMIPLDKLKNKYFINASCYKTSKNYLINTFHSHEDLVDAMVSSCLLPGLHTSITKKLDDKHLRDGYFSDTPYLCKDLHRVDLSLTMFGEQWSFRDFLPNDCVKSNTALYQLGITNATDNLDVLKKLFTITSNKITSK